MFGAELEFHRFGDGYQPILGAAVQLAALWIYARVFRIEYIVATVLAVETAVLHNFIWHERFTWLDRTKLNRPQTSRRRSLHRLLRFHLGNGAVSILGNLALMRVMVGQAHMNYLLANAIAVTLCSAANFLVSETWVFQQK